MTEMKWILVAGARPNFMKIAPLMHAVDAYNRDNGNAIDARIVHTGQHYDARMSDTFFKSLGIPDPDVNLEVGSGSHAEQVGRTMIAFEKTLQEIRPDWVVVVGDVNATLACSVTARKSGVSVAHVEAGLRSHDWGMPEEINRVVTDRMANLHFTTDEISSEYLRKEGVPDASIHLVGNIMIDSLEAKLEESRRLDVPMILQQHALYPDKVPPAGEYVLVTMHRPSNVDVPSVLEGLVGMLMASPFTGHQLVWPMHPRTRANLEKLNLFDALAEAGHVCLVEPVGYLEMLCLLDNARLVMTDSGGLQEESCVLGAPCLTMRWNTERPVTLEEHGGTCCLVGNDVDKIREAFIRKVGQAKAPHRPELWDGHTAERIVAVLASTRE